MNDFHDTGKLLTSTMTVKDSELHPVNGKENINNNQSLRAKISSPADKRFYGMLQAYVREIATIAGFSHEETLLLELAVEEGFVNILQHAYPNTSPGVVSIESELGPAELVLSLYDDGIPFDKSPESYPEPRMDSGDFMSQGLGFLLIRNAVDETRFENLGKNGKVLRLYKRLPNIIETTPELGEIHEIEIAPPQKYEIRSMHPDEAPQVPKLFWMAYGYSYKNENFYRPDGLLHLVGSGKLVSYVAVAENGDIVGHTGLLRQEGLPIAEVALIVVTPAHRGRKLMEALCSALEKNARESGLSGLCTDPVTSHPISQKKMILMDFRPCGLDLAACPPRQFKALISVKEIPQRESYLHCFKYLSTPLPVVVHVPQHHRTMILRIYENLQQSCTLGEPAPAISPGDYKINFDKTQFKVVIRVITASENQWPEILKATENLENFAGAEIAYLDLPLSQPASALLCELAEKAGFFFASVHPCEASDGDNLRLQRFSVPFDFNRLRIDSDFGKDLLTYVAAERERVRK